MAVLVINTLILGRPNSMLIYFYITKHDNPKQMVMLNLFQHLSAVRG